MRRARGHRRDAPQAERQAERQRGGAGRRRWKRILPACLLLLGMSLPLEAFAQELGVEEAESLVQARWFEGLPEERAARIGPEAAVRLREMLADPDESRSHANILVALGLSGQPGVFEAIAAWADRPRAGAIDRDTFRAWQALPFALGHLASHDRRALDRLESRLQRESAPDWHFRHHRGARLVQQSRRAAATALAVTGLPEAARVLEQSGQALSDPDLAAHLDAMRALHADRALERTERGRRLEEGWPR